MRGREGGGEDGGAGGAALLLPLLTSELDVIQMMRVSEGRGSGARGLHGSAVIYHIAQGTESQHTQNPSQNGEAPLKVLNITQTPSSKTGWSEWKALIGLMMFSGKRVYAALE